MTPHYFGSSEKQLLGVYHFPKGRARPHGVVLCPPAPQEYMRTHMAFRKLAAMLVREGFHVLRFDYYGTGDSAGGSREGSLGEWRQNVVAAATDLEECSGATKVSLVGLRLGATLAALAPVDAANLVLWEPVVDGRKYLDELRAIHEREFSDLLFPPRLPAQTCGGELLGFPLPLDLEAEIRGINLLGQLTWRAEHIMLVAAERNLDHLNLLTHLRHAASSGGAAVEEHHVPDESQSNQQQDAMLLSTQVLQVIAAALSRRAG